MSQSPFVDESSVLVKLAQEAWKWLFGLGISAVVFGLVVLAWPGRTVVLVAILFGIYLVVSGVLQLVSGFGPGLPGIARVLYLLTGALSLMVGLACFRDQLQSVLLLAVWIGISWLVSGVTRVVVALSAPAGTPGRGLAALTSAVIILGGVVMMTTPISSLVTLAVVSGCFLLAIGVTQIVEALQLRTSQY